MPRYDYRCRTCATTFELSRPMTDACAPARCPDGHPDAVKLLSTVALTAARHQAAAAGGCCGGACGCH